MNDQPGLFDLPRARMHDPVSSHLAAEDVKTSGRLHSQQQTVLRLVRKYPGRTAAELAWNKDSDDWYRLSVTFNRRLPELEPKLIHRGSIRKCGVTGSKRLMWWPT